MEGDFEEYKFDTATFNLVTSFNGLQYAADPVAALAHAVLTVEPGGAIAVTTWGAPEHCEMGAVFAALGAVLPPPPPGSGGPFALSAPGRLEDLIGTAGVHPICAEEVPCVFEYPDLATAWRALSASGPFVTAIRHAGEERVRDSVERALVAYRTHDGGIRLENTFRFVLGRTAAL